MISPEKVLGTLLKSGLGGKARGRGLGTGSKAAIGLGLLGVAMEAIEHFGKAQQGQGAAPASRHQAPGRLPHPGTRRVSCSSSGA